MRKLKKPRLLIAERFGKFYWRVLPGCPTLSREPFGVKDTWGEAKETGESYLDESLHRTLVFPTEACKIHAHDVSIRY